MKKIFFTLSVSFLLFSGSSCKKDDSVCQNKTVQSEQAAILAYAAANGIAGTSHSSGIYYQVINPGSGPTPTLSSKISVTYTGKLLNGTQFDAGSSPVGGWVLAGLIQGWQIGLPLIKKGGVMKLIIPSSLAYGCQGQGSITGNSILFFDIQLTDVQ